MPGPEPITDREYLIKIFDRVSALTEDYGKKCIAIDDRLEDHEGRIKELEKFDLALVEFKNGRSSWWISYKEPILILFSMGIGVILSIWGLR